MYFDFTDTVNSWFCNLLLGSYTKYSYSHPQIHSFTYGFSQLIIKTSVKCVNHKSIPISTTALPWWYFVNKYFIFYTYYSLIITIHFVTTIRSQLNPTEDIIINQTRKSHRKYFCQAVFHIDMSPMRMCTRLLVHVPPGSNVVQYQFPREISSPPPSNAHAFSEFSSHILNLIVSVSDQKY